MTVANPQTDLSYLAQAIEADGADRHWPAVEQLVDYARTLNVSPVVLSIIESPTESDVVRDRAALVALGLVESQQRSAPSEN